MFTNMLLKIFVTLENNITLFLTKFSFEFYKPIYFSVVDFKNS